MADRGGEHLWEGLVVGDLEREDHGGGIRGFDGLDVAQQGGWTVRVSNLQLAIEGELHILGIQVVAVSPLQAFLQLDRVFGWAGEFCDSARLIDGSGARARN